jgi:DNA polymerase-3 subunit gamma/tau
MTLDGQQRVIKSLEPAQALELLLLNLACLPDLLPLAALSGAKPSGSASGSGPATGPGSGGAAPSRPASGAAPAGSAASGGTPSAGAAPNAPAANAAAAPQPVKAEQAPPPPWQAPDPRPAAPAATPSSTPPAAPPEAPKAAEAAAGYEASAPASAVGGVSGSASDSASGTAAPSIAAPDIAAPDIAVGGQRTWESFLDFVAGKNGNGFVTGLTQAKGELCGAELVITCFNETHSGMLENGDNNARLRRLVADYFGPDVTIAYACVDREPVKSDGLIQREMQEHPLVQRVRETFECRDPALVYPRR